MTAASLAVKTFAATDNLVDGDAISHFDPVNACPCFHYDAGDLVPKNERRTRNAKPAFNGVNVRPTDTHGCGTDQYLTGLRLLRFRRLVVAKLSSPLPDEPFQAMHLFQLLVEVETMGRLAKSYS